MNCDNKLGIAYPQHDYAVYSKSIRSKLCSYEKSVYSMSTSMSLSQLVGRELIRKGELVGIGAFIEKMALDGKGTLIGFRRNLKAPTRKSTEK